jgi:hypothetical protein
LRGPRVEAARGACSRLVSTAERASLAEIRAAYASAFAP